MDDKSVSKVASTSQEPELEYGFVTNSGTPKEKFHEMIKEIDNSQGNAYYFSDDQFYTTKISILKADTIAEKYKDIIWFHDRADAEYEAATSRSRINNNDKSTRLNKRKDTAFGYGLGLLHREETSKNCPHLAYISAPCPLHVKDPPDYLFDQSLGQETLIYVIDTGFDLTHEVRTSF